ncbi:hypothetical protein OnM2_026020 [Erysiphe neolycopersici]|uniref:Inheritance of peroxisomes protein 1 n=1 Tax=Erysiphe neolycopersici TaxID=212602 RepID=A0A420I0R8_9PEZI|nr:hypothetical protein OnM2_026020 [Erysiphe neolycopersici]
MALLGNIRHYPRRASSPASVTSYLPQHSQIEILLSLPDVRIVEFKPLGLDYKSVNTNESALRKVEPGTLPWTSRFERTVAVGSLRIYRAPESIAFLNCQNAIRPILPKSQAWCVDEESKFVIGSPSLFWRIEVPLASHDEEIRVKELKRVLDQILRFEKTPCPFRRRVKEDLTPTPSISIKEDSQITIDYSKESNDLNNNSFKGFKNYTFDTRFPKANRKSPNSSPRFEVHQDNLELSEKFSSPVFDSEYSQILNSTNRSIENKFESHSSIEQSPSSNLGKDLSERRIQPLVEKRIEKRRCHSSSYNVRKSFTPHSLNSSGTTNTTELDASTSGDYIVHESNFKDSNSSSFQSLQSYHSSSNLCLTLPENSSQSSIPSHSDPYDNSFLLAQGGNRRSVSESFTVTKSQETNNLYNSGFVRDDKESASNLSSTKSRDEADKSDENTFEVPSALSDNSLHPQSRRALDGANFSKSNSLTPALRYKMLHLAHQVPTKIVRKTSDIFITPSNNLIQLMLGIASRIVSGEWRGVLSNFGEPIHWDFEDDSDDDWFDSDYRNSNRVRTNDIKVSGSWEFD